MDDEAGAARDALPRDVLDIAFEHVAVRPSQIGGRVEIHAELAIRAERGLVAADFLRAAYVSPQSPAKTKRVSGKCSRMASGGLQMTSRVAFHSTGRLPIDAPNRYLAVTTPVSRGPATSESLLNVASTRKSGRRYAATRKLPYRRLARRPRRLLGFSLRRTRPGFDTCRVPRPPASRNVHSALLHSLTLIVRVSTSLSWLSRTDHVDRRARRQQPDARRRVGSQNRLEVHFFAQPIHAAIGEHRSTEKRIDFARVRIGAEIPWSDPLVPRVAGIGEVAILLGDDDEIERRFVPVPSQPGRRTAHRRSVGSRGALPGHGAIAPDERDVSLPARARQCRGA